MVRHSAYVIILLCVNTVQTRVVSSAVVLKENPDGAEHRPTLQLDSDTKRPTSANTSNEDQSPQMNLDALLSEIVSKNVSAEVEHSLPLGIGAAPSAVVSMEKNTSSQLSPGEEKEQDNQQPQPDMHINIRSFYSSCKRNQPAAPSGSTGVPERKIRKTESRKSKCPARYDN